MGVSLHLTHSSNQNIQFTRCLTRHGEKIILGIIHDPYPFRLGQNLLCLCNGDGLEKPRHNRLRMRSRYGDPNARGYHL